MQTVFSLDDGGTAAAVAALASAALQAASKIDATPTQGVALGLGRAARWASNRRPLMRGRTRRSIRCRTRRSIRCRTVAPLAVSIPDVFLVIGDLISP